MVPLSSNRVYIGENISVPARYYNLIFDAFKKLQKKRPFAFDRVVQIAIENISTNSLPVNTVHFLNKRKLVQEDGKILGSARLVLLGSLAHQNGDYLLVDLRQAPLWENDRSSDADPKTLSETKSPDKELNISTPKLPSQSDKSPPMSSLSLPAPWDKTLPPLSEIPQDDSRLDSPSPVSSRDRELV